MIFQGELLRCNLTDVYATHKQEEAERKRKAKTTNDFIRNKKYNSINGLSIILFDHFKDTHFLKHTEEPMPFLCLHTSYSFNLQNF